MNNNLHSATALFQEIGLSTDKSSTTGSQKQRPLRIATNNKQQIHSTNITVKKTEGDWQRTSLIDEWMEKKRISMLRLDNDLQFVSSSSFSSHSSSPGFSSSDCESVPPKRNKDSCFPPIKQKHIPMSTVHSPVSKRDQIHCYCSVSIHPDMPPKSKSAALKMYADIKTSKLPISPGAKLTSFINYMFNGSRLKMKSPTMFSSNTAAANFKHKPRMSYTCSSTSSSTRSCLVKKSPTKFSSNTAATNFKQKPQMSYTCSSTSSSTRSCLVKKSPTKFCDKSLKKSVRFYATNIENSVDIRPRNIEHSPSSSYRRKDENLKFCMMDDCRGASEFVAVADDKDDAASDTSSELFEIDHIIFAAVSSNSNGSRQNDLPVFETTKVDSHNGAISNAEILF